MNCTPEQRALAAEVLDVLADRADHQAFVCKPENVEGWRQREEAYRAAAKTLREAPEA